MELLKHGAKLTVVKNTLTRRAAEAAGADALLALLEGPTAIAFVEADGDPGRGCEGAQRRGEGHEDPRPARRRPVGQSDHGRRDREAREAAAARRPAGPARRGDRCPVDAARRGAERAAAEPGGLIDARITQLEAGGDTSAPRRRARSEEQPVAEVAVDAASRGRGRLRPPGSCRGAGGRGAGGRSDEATARGGRRRGGTKTHRRRRGEARSSRRHHTTRERNETRWQPIRQRCSRHSAR